MWALPYILGKVWTTDGFYRETRNNMEKRRAEGCIAVDMECASVMAAAQLILEAYDMTTEAVCAKLMWILGQTTDRNWVEELFYTPVAYDILTGK